MGLWQSFPLRAQQQARLVPTTCLLATYDNLQAPPTSSTSDNPMTTIFHNSPTSLRKPSDLQHDHDPLVHPRHPKPYQPAILCVAHLWNQSQPINWSNQVFHSNIFPAKTEKTSTPVTKFLFKYCDTVDISGHIISHALGWSFPAKCKVCCKIHNIVYCLSCQTGGLQYVGQTKRTLQRRLYENFQDIEKLDPIKPLDRHCGLPGHSNVAKNIKTHVLAFITKPSNTSAALEMSLIYEHDYHMAWKITPTPTPQPHPLSYSTCLNPQTSNPFCWYLTRNDILPLVHSWWGNDLCFLKLRWQRTKQPVSCLFPMLDMPHMSLATWQLHQIPAQCDVTSLSWSPWCLWCITRMRSINICWHLKFESHCSPVVPRERMWDRCLPAILQIYIYNYQIMSLIQENINTMNRL